MKDPVPEDDCGRLQRQIAQLSAELQQRQVAEGQLQRAKQAAEAASLSKSQFLANMSHEIRTPLTAILGFSELLTQTVSDASSRSAAETIQRNGQYLLAIVNDILDLSKIEAGRLEVEQIECSPRAIIDEVYSLMNVRAKAKGLLLETTYVEPVPLTIRSDPTRIRQILINLVANAIKFTELGTVRIITKFIDSEEGLLQFDVVDEGIGIVSDELPRIFEPFSQADPSTTRKHGGTGLGLTICKRLTEMLGGEIWVESDAGAGSAFHATVATGPLEHVRWSAAGTAGTTSDEAYSWADVPQLDCRVLYAEDGPDNQRLVTFFLGKAGADVTLAVNGRDAVEKALSTYPGFGRRSDDPDELFDVILMDMQMPIMDGYEATRFIRAQGYDGPIIALTAHAMSNDREKCLAAGCHDFLTKPIDRRQLINMVAAYSPAAKPNA